MAHKASKQPQVFLSSAFRDTFDGEFKYIPLRRKILDNVSQFPVKIWAYDLFWPENSETPNPDADCIIDRCFSGIKDCDLFVFLLSGRHGSGVTYSENPAWVSYLELELFVAAMLVKPIVVLHIRGQEPASKLRDCMTLLSQAFAGSQYIIDDADGLYEHFRMICNSLAFGEATTIPNIVFQRLPEWLAVRRSNQDFEADLVSPHLLFLDGQPFTKDQHVDIHAATRLLDQVSMGTRDSGGGQKLIPHGAALFRIWSAMREMMGPKDAARIEPATSPLWNRALGMWATNASWFGLHGHLWMGPLAAINSQIALRKKSADFTMSGDDQNYRNPDIARASAIYSIAQRMHSRKWQSRHYRQVVQLTSQSIQKTPNSQIGAISIRGHAFMQMALLGQYWKIWDAAADFKLSLKLRENSNASSASRGEAKADLGFCMILAGRPIAGFRLLREGVNLMRQDQSPTSKAFLARGLRKLERAANIVQARSAQAEARQERLALATEIEAFDQAREP